MPFELFSLHQKIQLDKVHYGGKKNSGTKRKRKVVSISRLEMNVSSYRVAMSSSAA